MHAHADDPLESGGESRRHRRAASVLGCVVGSSPGRATLSFTQGLPTVVALQASKGCPGETIAVADDNADVFWTALGGKRAVGVINPETESDKGNAYAMVVRDDGPLGAAIPVPTMLDLPP